MPYCTSTGRSKPYSWRSCSWRTGSIPRSPASASIGSPGMSRTRRKVSSVIPKKVGMIRLTRVTRNRSIGNVGGAAPPLHRTFGQDLLQVDAVDLMPAERAELEADDLLANRLELHRMRDGEPRCLFLEDDLRLAVEVGALLDVGGVLGLDDQIVERLVAPFRGVAAADLGALATEQHVQEIVRIPIVAGPPALPHLFPPLLHALAVTPPFLRADLALS